MTWETGPKTCCRRAAAHSFRGADCFRVTAMPADTVFLAVAQEVPALLSSPSTATNAEQPDCTTGRGAGAASGRVWLQSDPSISASNVSRVSCSGWTCGGRARGQAAGSTGGRVSRGVKSTSDEERAGKHRMGLGSVGWGFWVALG